ncbi:MAG: 30S ribosomal protein S15 [Methanomassiliicoccaceae archaeon]|nr:30S ribosomal protein S15 [Methanomassiliicoccaceae archaeon]
MARMHARRKGRSCSARPMISESPSWVTLSAAEVEDLIVKMAKDGLTSARIGLTLRDQYGVPDIKLLTGKCVTEIMKEKGVASALPEDLSSLMRRAIALNVHLRENKGDHSNRRGLQLIESKIRRLEHYYKDNGILSVDWKYSLKTAELMLK